MGRIGIPDCWLLGVDRNIAFLLFARGLSVGLRNVRNGFAVLSTHVWQKVVGGKTGLGVVGVYTAAKFSIIESTVAASSCGASVPRDRGHR